MIVRPIAFKPAELAAVIAGGKTQFRRPMRRPPPAGAIAALIERNASARVYTPHHRSAAGEFTPSHDHWYEHCPFGRAGDQLWVREAWAQSPVHAERVVYRADGTSARSGMRWNGATQMPRQHSRLLLEVAGLRLERLQAISEADAIAEGAPGGHGAIAGYHYNASPIEHFAYLWDYSAGPEAWSANPWVWAIAFRVVALRSAS